MLSDTRLTKSFERFSDTKSRSARGYFSSKGSQSVVGLIHAVDFSVIIKPSDLAKLCRGGIFGTSFLGGKEHAMVCPLVGFGKNSDRAKAHCGLISMEGN